MLTGKSLSVSASATFNLASRSGKSFRWWHSDNTNAKVSSNVNSDSRCIPLRQNLKMPLLTIWGCHDSIKVHQVVMSQTISSVNCAETAEKVAVDVVVLLQAVKYNYYADWNKTSGLYWPRRMVVHMNIIMWLSFPIQPIKIFDHMIIHVHSFLANVYLALLCSTDLILHNFHLSHCLPKSRGQ